MTTLLLSPHRWTLRARLISTVVALLAVVCLVVGSAVTLALREFLYERLDKQVTDATSLTAGRYNDDGAGRGPGVMTAEPRAPSWRSSTVRDSRRARSERTSRATR